MSKLMFAVLLAVASGAPVVRQARAVPLAGLRALPWEGAHPLFPVLARPLLRPRRRPTAPSTSRGRAVRPATSPSLSYIRSPVCTCASQLGKHRALLAKKTTKAPPSIHAKAALDAKVVMLAEMNAPNRRSKVNSHATVACRMSSSSCCRC